MIYRRQRDRPTIAVVMRGFPRPDYDIWLGATRAAKAAGINVVTFAGHALKTPMGYASKANVIYELLSPERLDGVLLLSSGLGLYVGLEGMVAFSERLRALPRVSLQMRLPGTPSILIDNYEGMRKIVDHLIEMHDYRRIAFLRGPLTHRGARERYSAYVDSLEAHGLPLRPELVTPPNEGWDHQAAIDCFLQGFGPALSGALDAIVGTSAGLIQQALRRLQAPAPDRAPIRVPEEIAVAGFDDYPHLQGVVPPLTTTRVSFQEIGRQAVSLLQAQMRNEAVSQETVIPVTLVVRQSCGCPSRAVLQAGFPGRQSFLVFDGIDSRAVHGDGQDSGVRGDRGPGEETALCSDGLLKRREAVIRALTDLFTNRPRENLNVVSVDAACAGEPAEAPSGWVAELVDALIADLKLAGRGRGACSPTESAFLSLLNRLLNHFFTAKAMAPEHDGALLQDLVSLLREATIGPARGRLESGAPAVWSQWMAAEALLDQARVLISETVRHSAAAIRMELVQQAVALTRVGHTLTTVTNMEELERTLAAELPALGIQGCYLALYESQRTPGGWARLRFAWRSQTQVAVPPGGLRYPAAELLPLELRSVPFEATSAGRDEIESLIVEPLYVRDRQFGFVLFQSGPQDIIFEDQPSEGTVYDLLRGYISDALHGILLYDEAVHARQQAEEADRLKSRFLSMVSHELRTPLNLIVSLSEILLWEQDGYRQELTRIHASAQHLDGLIRDVLDLASSQVGQLKLMREPLDLRQALEVVVLLGEQMAQDKGLGWRSEIPDRLPKVWGDRTRLRQIAINLVSNAFRFTSEGQVALEIRADDKEIEILVSDTGVGVPEGEREAIFDEFRQSDRTAARGYGGQGLGLAISRRLVEMHGGSIGVRDSGLEGEGTTFYVRLPVMDWDQEELGGGTGVRSEVRPVLVLTERSSQDHELEASLTARGYTIKMVTISDDFTPSDPDYWLNQVLASDAEALILDMRPTSERGWDLMRLLKENPGTQETPVLFYSMLQEDGEDPRLPDSQTDAASSARGSVLALDYLTKPMTLPDLSRVLARQGMLPRACALGDTADADAAERYPATFVIADDDPDILAAHTWLLQSQLPESRVLQAVDGRQALALMSEVRPDLVLLDLMMPELSGFEVVSEMRKDPDLCNVPIVVLTARTLTGQEIARLNQGVTAVLGKGLFSVEETLDHLAAALQRSRGLSLETRQFVRSAMAYIHEHYADPITRAEIADHVNLSPRHLDRCFCEEMGLTPIAYLTRFRLRQARRLLKDDSLNISDVAAAVGFSDGSYFSRVFRREMGMSPSDYRQTRS